MSFYAIGIFGSVENARCTAKLWGVRLHDVEAIGSLDANGDARGVGARASLRYGKKLDRWYKHSGVRIKEIDAATPPEATAYLKSLRPEERLSVQEKLFDATRNWQSGLLLFYQPVIDTPVRTYTWIAAKTLGWLLLGLIGQGSRMIPGPTHDPSQRRQPLPSTPVSDNPILTDDRTYSHQQWPPSRHDDGSRA